MDVSGQLQAPAALTPGREPLVPIGGWVGPRAGLDAVGGEEKNTQPPPGIEP
jgi:hypothetical protein